jgi:hypothetical protein
MQTAKEREELFLKISSFLKQYGATKVSFLDLTLGEKRNLKVILMFWLSLPKGKVC